MWRYCTIYHEIPDYHISMGIDLDPKMGWYVSTICLAIFCWELNIPLIFIGNQNFNGQFSMAMLNQNIRVGGFIDVYIIWEVDKWDQQCPFWSK